MPTATRQPLNRAAEVLSCLALLMLASERVSWAQGSAPQPTPPTNPAKQATSGEPVDERSPEELPAKESARGWLGVVLDDVFSPAGVWVVDVVPNSPAARAGLRAGDLIRRVGETVPHDALDVAEAVQSAKPGDTVRIVVFRGDALMTLTATLSGAPRPRDRSPETRRRPNAKNKRPSGHTVQRHAPPRGWLGVETAPVTNFARRVLYLPNNNGAIVNFVHAGSPAERAGIRPGAVIRGIGAHNVTNPYDVVRLVSEAGPGQVVDVSLWVDGGPVVLRLRLAAYPPEMSIDPVMP